MRKKTPKYVQLAETLKNKIAYENYIAGQKFVTEQEISKIYDISRQTVRNAINILVSENILVRKQGSGTYISTVTNTKKTLSKTIGVVLTYFDGYIFPSLINSIESVISSNGYHMQLACTRNNTENEARILVSMLDANVEALIIEPTRSALPNLNKDIYEKFRRKNILVIFLNAYYPDFSFPYITMDDIHAGFLAVEFLIKNGHTKIAMCLKSDDIQGHLRYKGALLACKINNITILSENIFWFATDDVDYFGEDYLRFLRYIKNCTAIFCYNDNIATIVFSILEKLDIKIPNDYSVISIDDAPQASNTQPKLTTVAHPKELIGTKVAQDTINLLKNSTIDYENFFFKPNLVIRDSVKNLNLEDNKS